MHELRDAIRGFPCHFLSFPNRPEAPRSLTLELACFMAADGLCKHLWGVRGGWRGAMVSAVRPPLGRGVCGRSPSSRCLSEPARGLTLDIASGAPTGWGPESLDPGNRTAPDETGHVRGPPSGAAPLKECRTLWSTRERLQQCGKSSFHFVIFSRIQNVG